MIRAIIFDMDGVLVDSEPLHTRSWNQVILRHGGKPITPAEKARYLGTSPDEISLVIKKRYGLRLPAAKIRDEKTKIYLSAVKGFRPDRRLQQMLDRLRRRYALAVATSGRKEAVLPTLQKLGIRSRFRAIATSDAVKRAKPFPDLFLKAAAMLNISPDECIVIEDSAHGVEAARRAGMRCIAIRTSFATQRLESADAVVGSLEEALKEVKLWEKR